MSNDKPDIEPLAYPAEAILTRKQLADWLQVSEHTVKDWYLPRLKLPSGTVRYSAGQVLAYLEGRLVA
jgi:hypothetical protein